jgi:hypothetical protein
VCAKRASSVHTQQAGVCDQCRAAAMVQGIALPEQGSAHHVTRMQQIVLQWDYYKLTSRAKGKEKKKLRELRKVPERFQDIQVGNGDTPCVPSSSTCRAAATLLRRGVRYRWELIFGRALSFRDDTGVPGGVRAAVVRGMLCAADPWRGTSLPASRACTARRIRRSAWLSYVCTATRRMPLCLSSWNPMCSSEHASTWACH